MGITKQKYTISKVPHPCGETCTQKIRGSTFAFPCEVDSDIMQVSKGYTREYTFKVRTHLEPEIPHFV